MLGDTRSISAFRFYIHVNLFFLLSSQMSLVSLLPIIQSSRHSPAITTLFGISAMTDEINESSNGPILLADQRIPPIVNLDDPLELLNALKSISRVETPYNLFEKAKFGPADTIDSYFYYLENSSPFIRSNLMFSPKSIEIDYTNINFVLHMIILMQIFNPNIQMSSMRLSLTPLVLVA
jgi:hypothetical protein